MTMTFTKKLSHATTEHPGLSPDSPFATSNCSESHSHPMMRILKQRATIPPTSRLLEKTSPFLHQLFLFTEAILGIGENSLIGSHYYLQTHCQFNESEKNEQ